MSYRLSPSYVPGGQFDLLDIVKTCDSLRLADFLAMVNCSSPIYDLMCIMCAWPYDRQTRQTTAFMEEISRVQQKKYEYSSRPVNKTWLGFYLMLARRFSDVGAVELCDSMVSRIHTNKYDAIDVCGIYRHKHPENMRKDLEFLISTDLSYRLVVQCGTRSSGICTRGFLCCMWNDYRWLDIYTRLVNPKPGTTRYLRVQDYKFQCFLDRLYTKHMGKESPNICSYLPVLKLRLVIMNHRTVPSDVTFDSFFVANPNIERFALLPYGPDNLSRDDIDYEFITDFQALLYRELWLTRAKGLVATGIPWLVIYGILEQAHPFAKYWMSEFVRRELARLVHRAARSTAMGRTNREIQK